MRQSTLLRLAAAVLAGSELREPNQRKFRGPQLSKSQARIRAHKKARRRMARESRRRNRR